MGLLKYLFLSLLTALFRYTYQTWLAKRLIKLRITIYIIGFAIIILILPFLFVTKKSLDQLIWESPILCFVLGIATIYYSLNPDPNLNKFQRVAQWFVRPVVFLMGCLLLLSLKRFF